MENMKSIWLKIKESLNNSTIHAIPNILRSESRTIRFVWAIFFLSSLGYCSLLIVQSTIGYFKFGITTQVTYERVVSVEFPTVTFCNQKMFRYHDSVEKAATDILLALKYLIISSARKNFSTLRLIDEFSFNVAYGFKVMNVSDERKNMFSYSIDEMLINCKYNGLLCTKNDFEYVYIPTFGNCYKFNSGINLKGQNVAKRNLSLSGRTNGLTLELFLGYDDPFWDTYRTTGAFLFVHNSSTKHLSKENGFGLSTGFAHDIAIGQLFTNKLPKPYGMCIKDVLNKNSYDSFLFRQTISVMDKYEQKICLTLCLQRFISNYCDCYDPTGPETKLYLPCNQSTCIQQAYAEFVKAGPVECFDECPPECDSTTYDLKITQSRFPAEFYSQILIEVDKLQPWLNRNFSSRENLIKSTLSLSVYYSDIGYTIINEIPSKTFEQFFGEIGGLLGLCLGASLLSLVELIELLVKILFLIFKTNKNNTIVVEIQKKVAL